MPEAVRSTLHARFQPASGGGVTVRVTSTSGLELRGPFTAAAGSGTLPRYFLRNVTAGMLDGDDYEVTIHIAAGTRVAVQPTAAARIFVARGGRGGARIRTRIEVEAGAVLDFDAGLTIPHAGAAGEQLTEVTLHPGAALAFTEALAFGRLAHGERFAFTSLTSDLRVRNPEGTLMFHRRSVIEPDRDRDTLEMAVGGAGALASTTLLGAGRIPELTPIAGAYAGISALPTHDGHPTGYSALALASRPELALAAVTSARVAWIETALASPAKPRDLATDELTTNNRATRPTGGPR